MRNNIIFDMELFSRGVRKDILAALLDKLSRPVLDTDERVHHSLLWNLTKAKVGQNLRKILGSGCFWSLVSFWTSFFFGSCACAGFFHESTSLSLIFPFLWLRLSLWCRLCICTCWSTSCSF